MVVEPGRHLLDGLRLDANIDFNHLASIQSESFAWYTSHSSQIQADVLMRALMKAHTTVRTESDDGSATGSQYLYSLRPIQYRSLPIRAKQ